MKGIIKSLKDMIYPALCGPERLRKLILNFIFCLCIFIHLILTLVIQNLHVHFYYLLFFIPILFIPLIAVLLLLAICSKHKSSPCVCVSVCLGSGGHKSGYHDRSWYTCGIKERESKLEAYMQEIKFRSPRISYFLKKTNIHKIRSYDVLPTR